MRALLGNDFRNQHVCFIDAHLNGYFGRIEKSPLRTEQERTSHLIEINGFASASATQMMKISFLRYFAQDKCD